MKKMKHAFLLCILVLALAGCGAQQSGKVEYIGAEAAKGRALEAAGLTASQLEFSGTDMGTRNNVDYYQVSFAANGKSYQYYIDALTGTVIDSQISGTEQSPDSEQMPDATSTTQAPKDSLITDSYAPANRSVQSAVSSPQTSAAGPEIISKEEAKKAALYHAGVSADQVTFVKAELDRDDGRQHYEVEFYTADYREFDYDIDPHTGAVLSYDHDAEYYTPPASSSGTEITADKAKALALAQVPGATLNDIREFSIDYDDGRLEYEGTIYYNKMEYEFEIDGYSGAIRGWEVESIYD